jgi:hypothetical protein
MGSLGNFIDHFFLLPGANDFRARADHQRHYITDNIRGARKKIAEWVMRNYSEARGTRKGKRAADERR